MQPVKQGKFKTAKTNKPMPKCEHMRNSSVFRYFLKVGTMRMHHCSCETLCQEVEPVIANEW